VAEWCDGGMKLDQGLLEHWMAGGEVPGVGLALNEPVVIPAGPLMGSVGAVVSLLSLEPEPVYSVEVGGGRGNAQVPASALEEA